jgi:hypothetical protein
MAFAAQAGSWRIETRRSTLMPKIDEVGTVHLHGMGDKNASAVDFWNKRVLVVADEMIDGRNVVQVFKPAGADFRAAAAEAIVLDEPGHPPKEMDLEGIAIEENTVYVLGSHSSRRKKTDAKDGYAKNRAALMSAPQAEPGRDVLLRVNLDGNGNAKSIERANLRGYLAATEPFKSFGAVPSKENGIDLEGLAAWDGQLYVGFRGPVLRGNFTPILRCRFGPQIAEPEVLFVDLGGRGVRDLAHVKGGLLILAGPVGDGPGSYQLYLWDGKDGVPGTDVPKRAVPGLRLIGDLPLPTGGHGAPAKAEGVGLIEEEDHHWEILVVFDGLKDGHATRFRVEKP